MQKLRVLPTRSKEQQVEIKVGLCGDVMPCHTTLKLSPLPPSANGFKA